MICLKPLLPFALIALATPAFAQMDMSLLPDDPSSSTDPSIDLSVSSEEMPSSSDEMSSSSGPDAEISNETLPPPVTPAEAFQAFYDTCTSLSGGEPDAFDKANDAGWVPYDGADYGPYKRVYAGSREFKGFGPVEIWGSFENYPTQSLGYCRVDFGDPDGKVDLNALSGIGGLTGTVSSNGDNGVWESADKKLLVIAAFFDGSLAIEFNVLAGDTPKP